MSEETITIKLNYLVVLPTVYCPENELKFEEKNINDLNGPKIVTISGRSRASSERQPQQIFRSEKSFIIWETRLIVYPKEKMSLLVLCPSPLFNSGARNGNFE